MLDELIKEYNKLQLKYGDINLDSINFGGCKTNPDICYVFMNPTGRNIAANKEWKGLKAPWIGTKNVWDLFYKLNVIDEELFLKIKSKPGKAWTEEFANEVYKKVASNKIYITNLAKCTQKDARPLPDEIYEKYLELFLREIDIINPKKIILFGNQISTVVLKEKISISKVRKQQFLLNNKYKCYCVYYPVGNGRFNMDKSIEDITYIKENYL